MKRLLELLETTSSELVVNKDVNAIGTLYTNIQQLAHFLCQHIMKEVPTEVWVTIFGFIKLNMVSWLQLRLVSKQWYEWAGNIKRMEIYPLNAYAHSNDTVKTYVSGLEHLVLNVYTEDHCDFSMFTNLKKLNLCVMNNFRTSLGNLSILTNMTSLSITIPYSGKYINLIPEELKPMITKLKQDYLSMTNLPNLTSLTLWASKSPVDTAIFPKLAHLTVQIENLPHVTSYTGRGKVKSYNETYYGSIEGGKIIEEGDFRYRKGQRGIPFDREKWNKVVKK
jgi:hypothetical protein